MTLFFTPPEMCPPHAGQKGERPAILLRGQPATRQRDARRAVLLVAGVLALAPKTSCIPVATLAPVPSAAGLQGTGAQIFGNFASAAANEEGFPSRRCWLICARMASSSSMLDLLTDN